jgi:vancomycin resistance protein YoaR
MNRHLSLAVSGAAVAIAIVLPLLFFAVARALDGGEIAPNVNANGVEIGGMSEEDALTRLSEHEATLRSATAPFVVNSRQFDLDGATVDLDVDVEGAVGRALEARRGGGFLDQFAEWIRSFRTPIDVGLDVAIDDVALDGVFEGWDAEAIGLPPSQGGVEIVDGAVQADYPRPGEGIDREQASPLVLESLREVEREPVTLPIVGVIPQVTRADVDAAVAEAELLIDGDVTLSSTDPEVEVIIPAATIAEALRSRVELDPAQIVLELEPSVIANVVEPERNAIEQPARNAQFRINSDESVSLLPSRRATLLDIGLVATATRQVAAGPDRGTFPFRFGVEADFTTEEAEAMGTISRMSAYTTEHPAGEPRVTNIHLIADAVDGTIVMPGATFSLNDHVGPRTEEKGYVAAPMILRGEIVDDIGGGVSQFATTFYNAVFFGCYEDVEHRPHSYYFTRYPEGREATISWPTPDLVFRNDSDAVVLIDTSYSDTTITVKFFGNNGGRDCDAELSDRYDIVEPETEYEADDTGSVNPGQEVRKQSGFDGWSVDVTRIMRMPDGEVTEQMWTHSYQPRPEIIVVHRCELPNSSTPCPLRVPSVIGQTFGEATATLENAGFTIGDGGTVAVESASQDGLIQSQEPGSGAYAGGGTAIRVVVGVYTAPPPTDPPPDTTTTTPPDDG